MNGYWEAVERTARGLGGSARPRPRAMFEDDLASRPEGFEEVETEIDAAPTSVPADTPRANGAGAPLPTAAGIEVARPASAQERSDRPVPVASEPFPRAPDYASASFGAAAVEAVPPKEPELRAAPAEAEPRVVEIHEVQTNQTIIHHALQPDEQPSSTPVASAAPPPAPERIEAFASEPRPDPHDVLTVVPAQPIVHEPEPLRAAEPAEQPAIVIEIERIDVRIEPTAPTSPAPIIRKEPSAAPALNDYLAARSGP